MVQVLAPRRSHPKSWKGIEAGGRKARNRFPAARVPIREPSPLQTKVTTTEQVMSTTLVRSVPPTMDPSTYQVPRKSCSPAGNPLS